MGYHVYVVEPGELSKGPLVRVLCDGVPVLEPIPEQLWMGLVERVEIGVSDADPSVPRVDIYLTDGITEISIADEEEGREGILFFLTVDGPKFSIRWDWLSMPLEDIPAGTFFGMGVDTLEGRKMEDLLADEQVQKTLAEFEDDVIMDGFEDS